MKVQLIDNNVVAIVENAVVGETTTEVTTKEIFDASIHIGQKPNEEGFLISTGIMNNRADITFVDIKKEDVTEQMLEASKVSGGLVYKDGVLSVSDRYKEVYKQ